MSNINLENLSVCEIHLESLVFGALYYIEKKTDIMATLEVIIGEHPNLCKFEWKNKHKIKDELKTFMLTTVNNHHYVTCYCVEENRDWQFSIEEVYKIIKNNYMKERLNGIK